MITSLHIIWKNNNKNNYEFFATDFEGTLTTWRYQYTESQNLYSIKKIVVLNDNLAWYSLKGT